MMAIELYSKELRDPHQHELGVFGEVPSELMKQRKELASRNEDNHTWILVTDMIGGSEWLDESLVIYGVDVIEVDNLASAEARLRQLAQLPQKRVAGM